MSDLSDELTEISGVGEATAKKVMEMVNRELIEAQGESELPEEVHKAHKHAKDGNARMAASYLSQVVDE